MTTILMRWAPGVAGLASGGYILTIQGIWWLGAINLALGFLLLAEAVTSIQWSRKPNA